MRLRVILVVMLLVFCAAIVNEGQACGRKGRWCWDQPCSYYVQQESSCFVQPGLSWESKPRIRAADDFPKPFADASSPVDSNFDPARVVEMVVPPGKKLVVDIELLYTLGPGSYETDVSVFTKATNESRIFIFNPSYREYSNRHFESPLNNTKSVQHYWVAGGYKYQYRQGAPWNDPTKNDEQNTRNLWSGVFSAERFIYRTYSVLIQNPGGVSSLQTVTERVRVEEPLARVRALVQ